MFRFKINQGLIIITKFILIFSTLTIWSEHLFASGAIYNPSKVVLKESSYQACKGIKFLSKKDYERMPEYWNQRCRGGVERIQVLPDENGMFFKLQNATSSLALLSAVGEKVIKKMNSNTDTQENLLNCFKSTKKSSDCDKLMEAEIDNVYKLFSEMRIELALSEGEDLKMVGNRRGYLGKLQYPDINESINTSLEKKFLGTVGVYRPSGLEVLSLGEINEAKTLMQQKLEEIKISPEIKTDKERVQVFQQVRAAHKARYLEIFQQAPILTMMGKLPPKHDRVAINAAFSQALSELLKYANKERGKILNQWSRASMGPIVKNARAYRAEGDENRASEILNFMSYKPVVDEVLGEQVKENPYLCAVAEELSQAMENQEFKKEVAVTGAVIGGAIALTALTGGSAALVLPEMVPVVGGMALSAQTAVAIALGPGIGFYSRKLSEKEMSESKATVAIGLKKAEDLDRVDGSIVTGTATIGLDYLGIGLFKKTGETIFKSLAKKALMSEGLNGTEAEKLIVISQSTSASRMKEAQQAQARIKNSIRLKVKGIFSKMEPSQEELEAFSALDELGAKQTESIKDFFDRLDKILDKNEKKEVLVEAIKLIKLQNKEVFKNASPDVLKELNRQVVAIARYGEIKDPAKIAAILSQWDLGAKSKLSQVYEEAHALLKDSSFMSGMTLKERREIAFKKILEKKKVGDSQTRQDMCMCSGVCAGGGVAMSSKFNRLNLGKVTVCAKNDLVTWYLQK